MASKQIPFERKFSNYLEEHSWSPNIWAEQGLRDEDTLQWKDFNRYRCVVVLAEGKAGKTYEFKQKHQSLRAEGAFSFFIPLELLQDHDLLDVITEEEEQELSRWMETEDDAVFFLDALDELKLRNGTFRKALRKIQKEIGSNKRCARFFISCRPNDWKTEVDLRDLKALVGVHDSVTNLKKSCDGGKIFYEIISGERRGATPYPEENPEPIKVAVLLPLSRKEVVSFARLQNSSKAPELERHIQEKELWHLYQFPDDILSALDQLVSENRLGNLEEQLNFSIRKKLQEISDKKTTSLSEDRAYQGAERLALALILMKRRSINIDSRTLNSDGVCVADILTDWSFSERKELLGKPLFDLTGVGSVRFHHRSIQEHIVVVQ